MNFRWKKLKEMSKAVGPYYLPFTSLQTLGADPPEGIVEMDGEHWYEYIIHEKTKQIILCFPRRKDLDEGILQTDIMNCVFRDGYGKHLYRSFQNLKHHPLLKEAYTIAMEETSIDAVSMMPEVLLFLEENLPKFAKADFGGMAIGLEEMRSCIKF